MTTSTWQNRHHFYSVAAHAMHQVQVNYARKPKATGELDSEQCLGGPDPADLVAWADLYLALDEKLAELAVTDSEAALVFRAWFFSVPHPTQEALTQELGSNRYAVRTAFFRDRTYLATCWAWA